MMKIKEKYNFLFLCTGNLARSIIAESLLNRIGNGRFFAYRPGSNPTGRIHTCANKLFKKYNFNISELRSKNWDKFGSGKAPQMDYVVNAAGEACPIWLGAPIKLQCPRK